MIAPGARGGGGRPLLRARRLVVERTAVFEPRALEDDCGNCHDPEARQASDERCAVCHEKYGDELGVYNFAAHYLYRSDDFRRVVPGEHEVPCFTCHVEHEGRDVEITRVADARCQQCHFDSFE